MYYEPYAVGQLRVAYCYRVYFRFQTYRRLPQACLDDLRKAEFQQWLEPYGIRLLDVASDDTDLVCQVSLRPEEAVSVCASKFKGRLSKWLRTAQGRDAPASLLAKGYFASTVGDPTSKEILGYIERQGEHHGYTERPLPPVFSETYPAPADAAVRLDAAHNVSLLRFHLVFGSMRRKGVFTQQEAARVAAVWRGLEAAQQFALLKVSFVPDHVHVAVRVHPAVKPLALAVELMNAAQTVMFEEFPEVMIRYGSDRLWETGAYVGSFGDINSKAVREALQRWCGLRGSL